MGLFRVICEMDVEADGPQDAVVNACAAFAREQSLASWHVCRYRPDGECGPVIEVDPGLSGALDTAALGAPGAAFKP